MSDTLLEEVPKKKIDIQEPYYLPGKVPKQAHAGFLVGGIIGTLVFLALTIIGLIYVPDTGGKVASGIFGLLFTLMFVQMITRYFEDLRDDKTYNRI